MKLVKDKIVKIKKLRADAVVPTTATAGAGAVDLTAVRMETTMKYFEYKTGLALEIPPGHVGLIFPRSSISTTGAGLANSVGVIDSDYRGEVSVRFYSSTPPYQLGDRVAQLMVLPIPSVSFVEAEDLSETKRGEGSYGSTGR